MNERKWHLHSDLEGDSDDVVYKVLFYKRNDDGLVLYETLHLDSSPILPDVGDYVSFDFVTEEDSEEEVFRDKQGQIEKDEIRDDGKYDRKHTLDLEVKDISTTYRKHVTEEDGLKTTIKKTVMLE